MKTSRIVSIVAIVFIVLGAWFILQKTFFADNIELPSRNSDVSGMETVIVKDGEVIGEEKNIPKSELEEMGGNIIIKEIMITDGVKHNIPLNEVVQGCPSKDCIPSIDDPVYESPEDAKLVK